MLQVNSERGAEWGVVLRSERHLGQSPIEGLFLRKRQGLFTGLIGVRFPSPAGFNGEE